MFNWLKNLVSGHNSRSPFPAESRLDSLVYTILDTELTSLDSRSNRVLSIGALRMEGRKILLGQQFYRVLNPGVAVPAETVLVHGLRPADITQGESPALAVAELLEFATGTVLVGHFLATDLAALRKEMPNRDGLRDPAIDTARVRRWLNRRRSGYREDRGHVVEKVDLVSLSRQYGLEVHDVHHALYDAFLTAQLWQRLMAELELLGVRNWKALLRFGRA